MFSSIKLFVGALALVGVSSVMACDCGSGTKGTGTTKPSNETASTVVGQSSEVRTQRSPAADVSYPRSAGRGVNFESSAASVQSDDSFPRTTARGALNQSATSTVNVTPGSGNGRGRRE